MNRYFLYLCSFFGVFIIIGSVITIIENKGNKIVYAWLIFGIIGQLIHIKMHITRNNKNYNIARDVSTLNGSTKPGTSLILCTIGQSLVAIIYLFTRDSFHNKIFSDIGISLILLNMISRFITLIYNRGYTRKLLFLNSYGKYV